MSGRGDPARPFTPPVSAPPTVPGPIPRGETAEKWARVIGVISIVLGVLGILHGAWSTAYAILFPPMMAWLPVYDAAAGAMRDSMERWMPWQAAAGVALTLTAGLLLVSGIGMLGRRRWSVRLAWLWIVLKVAVVTGSALVTSLQQRDQMAAMAQSGVPIPGGMSGATAVFSAAIYWAWGVLYPAFLCGWLLRGSIRRQVARWG